MVYTIYHICLTMTFSTVRWYSKNKYNSLSICFWCISRHVCFCVFFQTPTTVTIVSSKVACQEIYCRIHCSWNCFLTYLQRDPAACLNSLLKNIQFYIEILRSSPSYKSKLKKWFKSAKSFNFTRVGVQGFCFLYLHEFKYALEHFHQKITALPICIEGRLLLR